MKNSVLSDIICQNANKYISFNDTILDTIFKFPKKTIVYSRDINQISKFLGENLDIFHNCLIDSILENPNRKLKEYNNEFINNHIELLYFKNWIYFSDEPLIGWDRVKIRGSRKLSLPVHLAIELTDKCNLFCKHCYRDATKSGQFMDKDKLFKAIDLLCEKGLAVVELTGGEVTLHPHFCEIVDYLCQKLDIVAILTNGYEYDKGVIKCIIKNKDKLLLNVSLDSSNEKYHDKFRGVNGAWKKTCNFISILAKNEVLVRVAMSVMFFLTLYDHNNLRIRGQLKGITSLHRKPHHVIILWRKRKKSSPVVNELQLYTRTRLLSQKEQFDYSIFRKDNQGISRK